MSVPMSRQKRIFLVIAALFIVAVGFAVYDINQRTSAPWEKGNLRTRIDEEYGNGEKTETQDSVEQINE